MSTLVRSTDERVSDARDDRGPAELAERPGLYGAAGGESEFLLLGPQRHIDGLARRASLLGAVVRSVTGGRRTGAGTSGPCGWARRAEPCGLQRPRTGYRHERDDARRRRSRRRMPPRCGEGGRRDPPERRVRTSAVTTPCRPPRPTTTSAAAAPAGAPTATVRTTSAPAAAAAAANAPAVIPSRRADAAHRARHPPQNRRQDRRDRADRQPHEHLLLREPEIRRARSQTTTSPGGQGGEAARDEEAGVRDAGPVRGVESRRARDPSTLRPRPRAGGSRGREGSWASATSARRRGQAVGAAATRAAPAWTPVRRGDRVRDPCSSRGRTPRS